MKEHNRVGGVIWLALGIGLCIGSTKFVLGDFHKPGPGFMPILSGAFLGLCGLILIFSSTSKRFLEEEKLEGKKILAKKNWRNFFLILLSLFSFNLLLEPLGFLLTGFLFLFFSLKLVNPNKWLMPLGLSLCAVILSYLLFYVLLNCQLPRGIFRFV